MDRSNYDALRKMQLIPHPRLSDTGRKQAEAVCCLQLTKRDADRNRACSSLGCLLFQHPDAHGEEMNFSNPFLEARCTAEDQQQKYRASFTELHL